MLEIALENMWRNELARELVERHLEEVSVVLSAPCGLIGLRVLSILRGGERGFVCAVQSGGKYFWLRKAKEEVT